MSDHAFSAKDFATSALLQWYVDEQREGKKTMSRRALELFEIIGEAGIRTLNDRSRNLENFMRCGSCRRVMKAA